jgi:hypothetical protein
MSPFSVIFVLVSVLTTILSLIAIRGSWRTALGIYLGAYILTTLIGATILSFNDGQRLRELGLSTLPLHDFGSFRYWFLLYMPLLVVSTTAFLAKGFWTKSTASVARMVSSADGVSPTIVLLLVFTLVVYCFIDLAYHGLLSSILAWGMSDYVSMISVRSTLFSSLTRVYFGIVYSALPALSQYALYETVRTRSAAWKVAFGVTLFLTCILYFTVVQKGVLLLYLLFLGIGFAHLNSTKVRIIALWSVSIVLLLNFLQTLFSPEWSMGGSFDLLIYRMAVSFPYYVNVYPEMIPYTGVDLGLHLFGLAAQTRDNLDIFSIMSPDITWTEGSAAGPGHMKAYAQAGLIYSFITLVIVGFAVAFVARLRREIKGPASFTCYVQSLVFLYYCTQTSVREAILSCYGLVWTIFVVGVLIVISKSIGQRYGRLQLPSPITLLSTGLVKRGSSDTEAGEDPKS